MTRRTTRSEAETIAVGRELGGRLGVGSLVLVDGPLGAGKTVFVRGVAAALGCPEDEVTSPTFALIQEYQGRLRLHHVDLYRLTPREVDDLPLDELLEEDVVIVEWPDRWRGAPEEAWRVRLVPVDGETRDISIMPPVAVSDRYSTR